VTEGRFSLSEWLFLAILAAILTLGWIGVLLAQLGLFALLNFVPFLLIGLVICCALLALKGRQLWFCIRGAQVGITEAATGLLLLLSFLLYFRPSEHYPLVGDSAIYANNAALLSREGTLVYHYSPLDGLDPDSRRQFYVPSSEQLSFMEIKSYQGLLFGAYYLMDAASGQVVSSRLPLFTVWMAIFYSLFGPRGALFATPFFGALSIWAFYLLGRRLFSQKVALASACLLALSFPQIYFSRASYSEVLTQFLLLSGLYTLALFLDTQRQPCLLLAGLCLGETLLARLDSLILLVPLLILTIYWLIRRYWQRLAWLLLPFGAVAVHALAYLLTLGRPYIGATFEILRLLSRLDFTYLLLGSLLIIAPFFALFYLVRIWRRGSPWLQKARPWGVAVASILVFVVAGWAYFIRPMHPGAGYDHEALVRLGRYLSPLAIWLSIFGLVKLLNLDLSPKNSLLLLFASPFALIFLSRQMVAPVYPVALRRHMSIVIPALLLLAGYGLLQWRRPTRLLKATQAVALTALFVSLIVSDLPYLRYTEAEGAIDLLQRLDSFFEKSDVVLFEPTSEHSQVGWFASPLWSLYGKNALLLNKEEIDEEALSRAMAVWESQGRRVYFVSQSGAPSSPIAESYSLDLAFQEEWVSSIIGQSPTHFAYIWHFDIPFYLYRLRWAEEQGF